ncbi:MAG: AAA family ATPase [Rhodobacteraceae bacterium]|nr:AAA family ATPase [Paracoccaceae bacterium]
MSIVSPPQLKTPPRIERLRVKNFRVLRDVELKNLTPFTVLLGPNGSGKSSVFDVFAFLAECFEGGLRQAWEKRGRGSELKSRGGVGPVMIEVGYRERPDTPLITYHLEVDEQDHNPVVVTEWLRWKRGSHTAPFKFLNNTDGIVQVISRARPEKDDRLVEFSLSSPDTLAANALGQSSQNPLIVALRNFILGWYFSHFSSSEVRDQATAEPQAQLNETGGNLANVIQYLSDLYPELLGSIVGKLWQRVPKFQSVQAVQIPDGRLLLQFKDIPFAEPVMARFVSDGTLKMLAYLVLLHSPAPPSFIGIEEPENYLHPRLLYGLGEECRNAANATQVLVTTHSPFFLDSLRPKEVRVLWRDDTGYTQCRSLDQNDKVKAFLDAGALLGDLWMEGHFEVEDFQHRGTVPMRNGNGH